MRHIIYAFSSKRALFVTLNSSFLPNIKDVWASMAGRAEMVIKIRGIRSHWIYDQAFLNKDQLAGLLGAVFSWTKMVAKSPKKVTVNIQEDTMGRLTESTDSRKLGFTRGIRRLPKVTKIAKNPHFKSPQSLKSTRSVLSQKSISFV
ncbi:MAG: hypothetical protein Q8Q86_01125, partial [Candidatus Daviesbacteria bacterium]|nr:hypothetical protein [Candidatus Daviesbacteria bacterium]